MSECQKIHPYLSQYLEGELTAKEKRLVAWHLNQCAVARKELFEIEQLRKRLTELPEPAFPLQLHDKILNHIYRPHLVSDASSEFEETESKPGIWKTLPKKPIWGLAIAAMMAFVFFTINPDWLNRLKGGSSSPFADAEPENLSEGVPAQGFPEEDTVSTAGETFRPVEEKVVAPAPTPVPRVALARQAVPVRKQKLLKNLAAEKTVASQAVLKPAAPSTADAAVAAFEKAEEKAIGGLPSGTAGDLARSFASTAPEAAAPSFPTDLEGLPRWSGTNARAASETQEVLADSQSLNVYWSLLNPGEPSPTVDFNKNVLLMIVSGEKPTAGWRVVTDHVEETAANIVIWFREDAPAPEGAVAQVVTRPWLLQVMPKSSKPILFKKKE